MENKKNFFGLPFILFIFVVILTLGMYFYNSHLESQNKKLDNKIKSLDENISLINKDPNILVYNLINKNKSTLDKLEAYSNIKKFVSHMNAMQRVYSLRFEWFNYSNWIITTKVETKNVNIAYRTVSKFIENYRKNKKAIFDLDYINRVVWNDKMAFIMHLKVKTNQKK